MSETSPLFPRAWRHAAWGVLFVLLVYWLREALLPIVLAWVVAYHLAPVVSILERRGIGRAAAASIVLLSACVVFGLLVAVATPLIVHEVGEFAKKLPAMVESIRQKVVPWVEQTFNVAFPPTLSEALDRLPADVRAQMPQLADWATRTLAKLLSGTASAIADLVGLLIIPILAFFFTRDLSRLQSGFTALIPVRHRDTVLKVLRDVNSVCSAFLRGKVIVSMILAIGYSICLWVSGVPMAVSLGLFAGVLNFIPFLGLVIGAGLSLAFALLDFHGWGPPAGVCLTFALGQVADYLFLSPRIVGERLGLSPLAFLVALLIGAAALGSLGLILAVPVAAVIHVWGKEILARYRQSDLYTGCG